MTGFVIYSMGDPDFIRLALLGLSHAFEQGALSIAKIGLMLGLLAAFWQGVWNPGKVEFKQFFIGFFLVLILFGKSVPVTLIHGDGVGADAIPPIPIGIALGGTIATNFGHAMADSLRQFYHTAYVPGSAATGSYRDMIGANGSGSTVVPVAGNGLQPFRELMKMRFDGNLDAFTSTSAYVATSSAASGSGAASAPSGGVSKNISKSIENYLSDCVLKDLYNQRSVQEANEDVMKTSSWAWGAMKVSYNGWTTSVNVDSGHGWKSMGCGSAYSKINSALMGEWKDIAEKGGSTHGMIDEVVANYGQAMLGSTNFDAWKIKVNQVMMYHFKKAKTRSRWASQAELMASQAEFEALDKRRVSTGVQYSLWSEMAIPLMTYIEAFVFLIGPLMPFIVAFGEKGAGMVLKYFFLLIWVNTWPILQVGVNMYLQNAINKASFGSMPYDAFSWSGFNTTFTEIESFIAMGSTLQTMVPALSLMLLYGSVHTAINMSNSAQKGGGSEGSVATPKAAGSADSGKLSVGHNSYTHDANIGGVVQSYTGSNAAPIGMSQNNTKTDLAAATSNNIQAAKQRSEQASTTSMESVSEMISMMKVGSDGQSMQLTEGATRSQGMQRANAYADSLMKIQGMDATDAKTLGLALAGGMGVKAQAEAAAALGFNAKAGNANAGGEVGSSGKFGVGIKGEVSAQATSKLDTAISNMAKIAEQKGNNWSFSNTEQGSAVLASAEQLSTSNATGNQAGFGESGQKLEQASKVWSDANSLIESETRNLSAIQGFSGGTSFNLAGVTSDAAQNRNDEKLADGSLLTTHARNTAFGAMNAEQKSEFDKFKKEGGYDKGLNGDIQALKDFSQTKEGASLAGMSSNFKTTQENAADYERAIAADVGNDKSLQARREATGRYADAAFKNIMSTYGSERFEASAKFLEQLNANAGGKMANWAAAAADFRSMGVKAEQPLSTPPPKTAEEAGGPTAEKIAKKTEDLKANAQNFVASKGAVVSTTDPNATHSANVEKIKQDNQADPTKVKAADELGTKVDQRIPKDGVVESLTQPLSDANVDAAKAIAPLGDSVAGVASTLNDWVNGDAQQQAANQLSQDGNVSGNTAKLMTGGGSQTPHSEVVDRMKNGLGENASSKDRESAIELIAASHAAGEQIERLRATGNADDAKVADDLQKNVNSVNAALEKSPLDETQKEVLKGLGEKVANGELNVKSANAGFEMMNNDKYDAAKTQHAANVATRGTSYRELEVNQRGGKAALDVLESKGLTNSDEYKSLEQKTQDNQNVLDANVKSRAVLEAQEAYRSVEGNMEHLKESRTVANAIISSSINGRDYNGLKDASIDKAMEGDRQDNSKSFTNFFKDSDDNVDAMKKYEGVREGLVAASDRLRSDPQMAQYADNLDATIAKLDKQAGFDMRVEESLPATSPTGADGQGTTPGSATTQSTESSTTTRSESGANTAENQDNAVGNATVSNDGTVATQTTASSTTTRSESGANTAENQDNAVGNATVSNDGTVATQTTESSTTTRSESGANTAENQDNAVGNATVSNDGTVATQTTESSTTTRSESGANTAENQDNAVGNATATNDGTVATQTTESSTTTRSESGANTAENQDNAVGNATVSNDGTVATQTSESSTTTRSESGANTAENQDNAVGNATATNDGTVATQTTESSTTTRSESGANTAENQDNAVGNATATNDGTVATQTTESSTTTRSESGVNTAESKGATGSQTTSETTVATTGTQDHKATSIDGHGGDVSVGSPSTIQGPETVSSTSEIRGDAGRNSNAQSESIQDSQSQSSGGTGDTNKVITPDSQHIAGEGGEADRIKVSTDGFAQIHSSPEGAQMEIGGETFTKVSGGENGSIQTAQLQNNESGEVHNLYQNTSNGAGNLTIESLGGVSRT